MVLTGLDWLIVALMFLFLAASALVSRTHVRSVADFLAAGRSAGRYIIAVSSGAAALGAITVVGTLEMNFLAGFAMNWWGMTMGVVVLVATAGGWVIYRFRRTRCLTLAQFFELRYSRRFRIFTGLLAFLAGIVNMGIFPAVEARFFQHFCGFPPEVQIGPISLAIFPLLMILLLAIAISFLFLGGQVAVIVADFLQGAYLNVAMLVIALFFFFRVDWTTIEQALRTAPVDQSLINPFHTSAMRDFNFWYFLIGVFGFLYSAMSWQGTQAYNASATNAHEARMAGLVGLWRGLPQNAMLTFVPIAAYTVLHHENFRPVAEAVQALLPAHETEAVQNQLKVPLVMRQMMPPGLIGVFVAAMLAASITTFNSYLHSWGSILVQDVIIPLRGRPLSTKAHLRALRLAILGVACFVFGFSMIFRQTQYIFLFFAITGAIFAGGSGAVIIGGLYWRRGTAPAAWAAMLTGSGISVAGIIIHQYREDFFLNGQEFWALAMAASTLAFIAVSLLGRKRTFDLDGLFRRGDEEEERESAGGVEPARGSGSVRTGESGRDGASGGEDASVRRRRTGIAPGRSRWIRRALDSLGAGPEFTRGDRILLVANYVWTLGWFVVFLSGTALHFIRPADDAAWMRFWKIFFWFQVGLATVTVIWFTTGGFLDLRRMLQTLRRREYDPNDDGFVRPGGGARPETAGPPRPPERPGRTVE